MPKIGIPNGPSMGSSAGLTASLVAFLTLLTVFVLADFDFWGFFADLFAFAFLAGTRLDFLGARFAAVFVLGLLFDFFALRATPVLSLVICRRLYGDTVPA
jgi:hypothetical protein